MFRTTNIFAEQTQSRESKVTTGVDVKAGSVRVFDKLAETTLASGDGEALEAISTSLSGLRRRYESPVFSDWSPAVGDSTPLQIWEGKVRSFDLSKGVMHVFLDAKMGELPRHSAEIDLEWVSDQDKDLLKPGAVFYLTLFKRTKRGSIQNSQELRFRRRPSWSESQLKRIDKGASGLLLKMVKLPLAE